MSILLQLSHVTLHMKNACWVKKINWIGTVFPTSDIILLACSNSSRDQSDWFGALNWPMRGQSSDNLPLSRPPQLQVAVWGNRAILFVVALVQSSRDGDRDRTLSLLRGESERVDPASQPSASCPALPPSVRDTSCSNISFQIIHILCEIRIQPPAIWYGSWLK